jgi:hypothetical protein
MVTLENVRLKFRLGDTWESPQWAVLVDDLPVNLAVDGWVVRCQARRRSDKAVLEEWSTGNGRVRLDLADVVYGNTGESGETSTIQLIHSARDSDSWDPFAADFEVEIERGSGANTERHTVVSGRIYGLQDVTDA